MTFPSNPQPGDESDCGQFVVTEVLDNGDLWFRDREGHIGCAPKPTHAEMNPMQHLINMLEQRRLKP